MKHLCLLVVPVPLLQLLVAVWGYGAATSHQNWGYRATGWSYVYNSAKLLVNECG